MTSFKPRQIKIAITGHRDWKNPKEEKKKLFYSLDRLFKILRKNKIYKRDVRLLHGCARGVDLWTGEYAIENLIELELYLPFRYSIQIVKGRFSKFEQQKLKNQLLNAMKVKVVNKTYHTVGYEKRNRDLVSHCNLLLTYYTRKRSGSHNAKRFAKKIQKPIIDLRNNSSILSPNLLNLL